MDFLPLGTGRLALPERLRALPSIAGDEPPPLQDPSAAVAGALARPLGLPALDAFVEPGDRVAVVVPDATRRGALEVVLPPVLAAVRRAGGVPALRIANGTHRRATRSELLAIASACGLEPGDRDCEDPAAHESLGRTAWGTARVDAEVARADRLVLVGPVSFHYLAGFGGGGKLLAPGCADRATALAIHRACLAEPGPGRHPRAAMGALEGNPLHARIAPVLALAPPAFLVQVGLRRGGLPAAVFAGDVRMAHAAAADFHRRWHERDAGDALDLVIASAGGAPHDLDLYQAHKALEAAAHAVRPGGGVVLVARCAEGAGSPAFAPAAAAASADALELALRRDFSIAAHTALALRRKTEALRCAIVGAAVDPALLRGLGLVPAADLEAAVEAVGGLAGRAALLPEGARTLPRARGALLGG